MNEEMTGDTSSRTLCEVLNDMRNCLKTLNFSYLNSLIEEGQYRANRMENAIEKYGGWNGVREMERRRLRLKKEVRELEEKKEALEDQFPKTKTNTEDTE